MKYCSNCGSTGLRLMAWVLANDPDCVTSMVDGGNETEWCTDCEREGTLVETRLNTGDVVFLARVSRPMGPPPGWYTIDELHKATGGKGTILVLWKARRMVDQREDVIHDNEGDPRAQMPPERVCPVCAGRNPGGTCCPPEEGEQRG